MFTDILGDCSANGDADYCDIVGGDGQDIGSNGIPDECESCDGDADGDGLVDPLDSGFVPARFGRPVGTGDAGCDIADMSADGLVGPLDESFVRARFDTCQYRPGESPSA